MNKRELVEQLADVSDGSVVYLQAEHVGVSVECTEVDKSMSIAAGEPVVVLR